MKLYVFYFSRVTKEVVRDEVEVESMSKEEFIALIGQDVVVDYNFCGELQQWSMKNFSIKDGVIRHNRLPLIVDVFIKGAHNPHKGEATHG